MLGKISAYGAIVFAVLFAAFAALQAFSMGVGWDVWPIAAASLALAIAGMRTIHKQKGGLRLLAGIWGLVLGATFPSLAGSHVIPDSAYSIPAAYAWPIALLPVLAFAGLALAVLHKE